MSDETTAQTPEGENSPGEQENDFTDADREKLTEVVRKERAAAKAAKASAEQAESRVAELEAAELRRTVAEEKGLSSEQAAFLTGKSAEEMSASADALVAAFGSRQEVRRMPRETWRTGATGLREPAEDMSKVAERVLD